MFGATLILAATIAHGAIAGVVPNDGNDDRDRLQKWIDDACASPDRSLFIPPGDWHVTRRPGEGAEHAGSLQIRCDGLTVSGAGRRTRIVMTGSGRISEERGPAYWSAFVISANGVTLDNIAVDGAERSDTGEQTHLIEIQGPARGTRLRRLFLNLPILTPPPDAVECKAADETRCFLPGQGSRPCAELPHKPHCSFVDGVFTVLGWFQGGDCIRTLGERNALVDGVDISRITATACARSFVALQRWSRNFIIAGNVTSVIGGQTVDLEPSEEGGIGNVVIRGNRFARGSSTPRLAAISLAGTGNDPSVSIEVSDNVLEGGVVATNVARVMIRNNRIVGRHARRDKAIIDFERGCEGVQVIRNRIERTSDAGVGAVISIAGTTGATIVKNTLNQRTAAAAIAVVNARGLKIIGNSIHCDPPNGGFFAALHVGERVTDLVARRNRASGSCLARR